MRVLLDHDVPHGLRLQFPNEHEVVTAQYQGWADLDNGDLLQAAEGEYAVLVTLDHKETLSEARNDAYVAGGYRRGAVSSVSIGPGSP